MGTSRSRRRTRLFEVLVLLALAWLSAAGADGATDGAAAVDSAAALGPALVLEIGPRSVPCDDVVPRRCFEAREAGDTVWTTFDAVVDGYAHRDGHAAVVLVRRDDAAYEEGGPQRFVLVQLLAELPLGGASWTLERWGELSAMRDPVEHTDVGFVVTSGGTHLQGTAGCNAFTGPIAIVDDEVRIGPLVITRRDCDGDVLQQEETILAALRGASRVTFYNDAVAFAGDELRVRFGARLAEARLTWTQGPDDPELERFNELVAMAAADGASWTRDPVRVALALIDSRGAPRVDIVRRDDRAEAPTSSLVRVDEDGFLDDSVRGVRSEIVLEPDDEGAWRVLAITVVTRCWRGERLVMGPGETCP